MNKTLNDLREGGVKAYAVAVQIFNWIALTIGGLVLGLHEMFPTAVQDYTATLPAGSKFVLLAAWAGIVHYFLRQAKKAA